MSDRPGPFDKLHEETEQDIERYKMDDGVVDELVEEMDRLFEKQVLRFQNQDSRLRRRRPYDRVDAFIRGINIPSEEAYSPDVSTAIINIADSQYSSSTTRVPEELKVVVGCICSAVIMELDQAYPKHWEISLRGRDFPRLFEAMSGVNSLSIQDCSGDTICSDIRNVEYICFEKINAGAGVGMSSIGTAVFKDIEETVAAGARMEIGVFLDVSAVGKGVDFERAILNDVSRVRDIGAIQLKKDESISAYIKKDISTVNSDDIETILYGPSAGIDVPEDAAEMVRPLTDEEYQVIEELADGPPPNEQEVADAIAKLNEGLNNDE
jgi:hypothetical protein